jgi:tetratricopeptide (TPR) repeat protein
VLNGLTCTGYVTKQVTAVGVLGNQTPITVRHEWWISDEYHFNVLEIHSDAKSGERTNEVVDFKPVEPDPARFHLPSGYTVKEVNPAALPMVAAAQPEPALDVEHAPSLSHDEALIDLASKDKREQLQGAAALVREARAGDDAALKDDVAYRLARAFVGIPEAQSLAEAAVNSAEAESGAETRASTTAQDFTRAITLARRWNTLGYIHYRQDHTELAKAYLRSAFQLDPLAYYGSRLARLMEETGDSASAVVVYREALGADGGEGEKTRIRERLHALAEDSSAPAAEAERPLDVQTTAAGTALFDVTYSTGVSLPAVNFVSGQETLQTLQSELAKAEATEFVLPDHGPERVTRRVRVSCEAQAGGNSNCRVRVLGAHQSLSLFRQP